MRLIDVFFASMVAVIWGANFVAAKFGVAFFPPFLLTAIRFTLVAALVIPFVPRPNWQQLKRIMVLATMSTLHFSLIFRALYLNLDIASGALVGQLGVPFACLLGAIFLGDRIGIWRISGIIISFLGIAIIVGTPNILEHMPAFYAALGSTLTWGIANILIKRISGVPSMSILAWVALCNVPLLILLSYFYEFADWPVLSQAPLSAVLGVLFSTVFSTIIAYGLWYYLLGKYSVSQVTPYSLMTPVFGIAFGQLFFHETLTLPIVIGGIVTMIGVAVIVGRRPKTIELGEAT